MAGGTLPHGLICGNIFGELRMKLKEKDSSCVVINSDVKLNVFSENSFLYPDAMVICGEIEMAKQEKNAVTNPVLIVEVLSKSTASYDRGHKFYLYRQIETLQEYVLIEQDKPQVEIYKRTANLWDITRIKGINKQVYFSSLELSIPMKDIYERINWGNKIINY